MMKALRFIKDNLFAVGALCGALIAAIFAYGSSSSDKLLRKVFDNKKKSDQEKLSVFKDKLERVQKFQEIHDNIISEAKRKEEEITIEQKEELERRRSEYFNADTPEKRQKVIDDIQNNFGELNYVPLDSIATVEKKDD
jgi:gas vesicle protein